MLVLKRRVNERIGIGNEIVITVERISIRKKGQVTLKIAAPRRISPLASVTRYSGDRIRLGDQIAVTVGEVTTNTAVSLAFDAPREIPIARLDATDLSNAVPCEMHATESV